MFSTPISMFSGSSTYTPPPSIPTDQLSAWFKSDIGVSTSGGLVTSWASQFGVAGLVANTGTQSPSLSQTLNGYTAVTMPTGSTPMNFNNTVATSAAFTFFAVARQTGNYAEYVITRSGGSLAGLALTPGFGGPGIFLFDGSNAPIAGQNLTTPQYCMWQSSVAGTVLRQNGTQVLSGGTRIQVNPTGLFSTNSSGTISIWELLIYGKALNSTEISQVESYLTAKYAL